MKSESGTRHALTSMNHLPRCKMRNSRQRIFRGKPWAPIFAVLLTAFATGCVPIPIVVMSFVSKSALFMSMNDAGNSQTAGPISIEEMLARVSAGNQSGKSWDASRIQITFSLPPEAIDLSEVQRADLEEKLRDIDSGAPYEVVISSGPGGRSGDARDTIIAAQRVRSAAMHFSGMTGKPRLRYDPALAPGELRIIIEPAKKSDNA